MKAASSIRVRLDQHLHEAGYFDSREKAQRAILAGQVTVGGRIADKPGTKISSESEILITGRDRYVGRGQLAWSLRQDPRVEVHEGVNARYLTASDFKRRFDLIVGDLSFISLTKILPAAFELLHPDGVMIMLIKPQFELSRADVGKGGIVRDPLIRQRAIEAIRTWVVNAGHRFDGVIESPLPGTSGNIEFLALLRRGESTAPLPA